MKKYILCFLLAAITAFTACSTVNDAVSPENNSSTAAQSEQAVVLTESQQLVMSALEQKNAIDFFGNTAYSNFVLAGYRISVDNLRFGDDDSTLLFDLKLTEIKSGEATDFKKLTAGLDYTTEALAENPDDIRIEGIAAGICDEEIYIADLDRIRFFDINTLERTSTSVFFEHSSSDSVMFYNVAKIDGTYIIACRNGGEYVLLMTSGQGGVYELDINLENDSYLPFSLPMSIRDNYPSHILFGDEYCYDTDLQVLYSTANRITGENNGETFYFEKWQNLSTTGSDYYQLTVYRDGKAYTDIFENLQLSEVFGINQQTGEFGTNVTMTFEENGNHVVIHCPDSQASLVLDRENDTGTVQYTPDAGQIKVGVPPVYSRDMRYAIYRGASAGKGDSTVTQLLLHDRTANVYSYMGLVSSDDDVGFFTNNDIYIFNNTEFTVYKTGVITGEPDFVLSHSFPLGKIRQGDVYARYLFAARRDPVTNEYIVIYADFPEYKNIEDLAIDTDNMVLDSTYKIGLLDAGGVLQHTIDTGCNVWRDADGFKTVTMVKPNADTLRFTVKRNSSVFAESVVHLDSETVDKVIEAEWVTPEQAEQQQSESEAAESSSAASDSTEEDAASAAESSSSAENSTDSGASDSSSYSSASSDSQAQQ